MMDSKNRISLWGLIIVLCGASLALGADVAKIGVIDFQRIFENSSAGKLAQAELNKQGKKMEEDLKSKGEEIQEIKKQLEREAMVMSAEKREEKEREGRIKLGDLKVLQKKYRQELQDLEKKYIDAIQKSVVELARELGKNEGYLLIMERTGVIYTPDSVDITDKIIQIFNADFAKKGGKLLD